MIAIIRKDAVAILVSLFVLWPVIVFTEILKVDGLDLGLVLINSCFVIVLTIGSILVNEIEEEINGGYKIFNGLPVRKVEIVNAKFLGAFILTLAFVTSHFILATFWSTDPDQMPHIQTVLVSSGVISLSVVGVLYVGVFVFGLTRAVSYLGVSFWIASAGFIILTIIFRWNVDSIMKGLVQTVGRADLFVTLSIGLLIYGLTWLIAIRFFGFEWAS